MSDNLSTVEHVSSIVGPRNVTVPDAFASDISGNKALMQLWITLCSNVEEYEENKRRGVSDRSHFQLECYARIGVLCNVLQNSVSMSAFYWHSIALVTVQSGEWYRPVK